MVMLPDASLWPRLKYGHAPRRTGGSALKLLPRPRPKHGHVPLMPPCGPALNYTPPRATPHESPCGPALELLPRPRPQVPPYGPTFKFLQRPRPSALPYLQAPKTTPQDDHAHGLPEAPPLAPRPHLEQLPQSMMAL